MYHATLIIEKTNSNSRTFIRFCDEDPGDKSDVFEIEISIDGLSALVKKFQGLVYPEIIKDMG